MADPQQRQRRGQESEEQSRNDAGRRPRRPGEGRRLNSPGVGTDGRVERVLVTRLRWLGDVVMSTVLLEVLREALPGANIEYLTYDRFAPVLGAHPACDRVHTLPPKPGVMKTLAVVRRLRRPGFDWCFDTLGNPRSAILVKLLGPAHSVGPARGVRSFLYEHRCSPDPNDRSAIRRQLDLLTPLLGRVEVRPPSLFVRDDERRRAAERLEIDVGRPLVLVHPGATTARKVWPVERWPALIEALRERNRDLDVRLITQPGWEAVTRRLARASPGPVTPLDVLDIRSLLALLTHAALYLGNDSGVLHAAVALRVPTVGIFGPTDDEVWFPYTAWGPYRSVRHRGKSGRPDVGVAEVVAAAVQVGALGRPSERSWLRT